MPGWGEMLTEASLFQLFLMDQGADESTITFQLSQSGIERSHGKLLSEGLCNDSLDFSPAKAVVAGRHSSSEFCLPLCISSRQSGLHCDCAPARGRGSS